MKNDVGNSAKTKQYWLRLAPAVIWHILYLVFCQSFEKYTRVYFDCTYYAGLAIYFYLLSGWRFKQWGNALKQGKSFWLPVLFTALGMAAMFGAGFGVSMLFPNVDDGMGVLGVNSWPTLIAFAFTTIVLPPLAEEAFMRKAVIAFNSKTALLISAVASVLLYASEHSLAPLGFLQACFWAIPFCIAYIKTKNVYVCITAHLACNILMNVLTVVSSVGQLMK